ncbi:MAG: hypothetical protein F7B17_05775 [Desulfurococcales archaeon]|nr:hypothetical protein [Desulfurococcales archaeon]
MAITGIFRRFWSTSRGEVEITPQTGVEVGFDFDDLIAKLQLAKVEVDRVKHQVLEEARLHASRLVEAAKRRDMDSAQIHAAELVLKKKMYTALSTYSRLLELAIVRVQDARNIESLARALSPLEFAMRAMDDYLAATSPEVAARLASIVEAAERVVRGTSFMASNLPIARSPAEIDPEIQREIARVMAEVAREAEEVMPSFDVNVAFEDRGGNTRARAESAPAEGKASKGSARSEEEVDRMVLEYIKSSGGVIKLSKAAKDLGLSREEVVRALRRLSDKGLIKIAGAEAARA